MAGVHESVLHNGVGGCIITPNATIPGYPLERSTFVAPRKLGLPLEVSAYQACQAHQTYSSSEKSWIARLMRPQGGVGERGGDGIASG